MRIETALSLLTQGVVSWADRLQPDAITVGALDNYLLFDQFWPSDYEWFYITKGNPSVC
jgi:hypothetical protein